MFQNNMEGHQNSTRMDQKMIVNTPALMEMKMNRNSHDSSRMTSE